MTDAKNPGAVEDIEPCPFCGAEMAHVIDKEGEFWMHPGVVTDDDCFMSGQGVFPRQLAAWNHRIAAQPAATVQEVVKDAVCRIHRYFDELAKMRQNEEEKIHSLHLGTDREASLLASDIKKVIAALAEPAAKAGDATLHERIMQEMWASEDEEGELHKSWRLGTFERLAHAAIRAISSPSPQPDMGNREGGRHD